jgi:hypothetical protein
MVEQTQRETIQAQGGQMIDQLKRLVHEGNIRRIVIKQGARTVAEFPLTLGVVGVVLGPVFAAVGVLAALLTECTIEIERDERAVLAVPPAEPMVTVPIMTEQPAEKEPMTLTEPTTA